MHAQPQPEPTTIRFAVRMIPTAKGRPMSFVRKGKLSVYTPAHTDQAERDFIALADPFAPELPLEGPVALGLRFVFPIPPSWTHSKKRVACYHTGRPDADNCVKLVKDAMTRSGRFWRDDSQVAETAVSKVYGPAPQIDVVLESLAGVLPRSPDQLRLWLNNERREP